MCEQIVTPNFSKNFLTVPFYTHGKNKLKGDSYYMNNLQRLQMEVQANKLPQENFTIYLEESGLKPFDEYKPASPINKKLIYKAALSVLESIANDTSLMKNIKHDDMTVSDFSDNLNSRISALENKIRKMSNEEKQASESSFFMLFNN